MPVLPPRPKRAVGLDGKRMLAACADGLLVVRRADANGSAFVVIVARSAVAELSLPVVPPRPERIVGSDAEGVVVPRAGHLPVSGISDTGRDVLTVPQQRSLTLFYIGSTP